MWDGALVAALVTEYCLRWDFQKELLSANAALHRLLEEYKKEASNGTSRYSCNR